MKTAKIALVANSAWYIYNFRMGLIRALQNADFDVIVITPIDDFINHIYESGVKYYPLYKLTRKSTNPFHDIQLYREIYKIYETAKPDLVIQYTVKPNIYGGRAAKKLGIKAISVIPGLGHAFLQDGILQLITKWLYRRSLKHSAYVVFENQSDRQRFVDDKIIHEQQAVAFKGCGVDTEYFKPTATTQEFDGRVFLYMGRLILEKGIGEYVRAAHLLAKAHAKAQFWIIGHIDEENPSAIPKDDFLKWIEHPQVQYLGFKHDVRQVIANADCVVLPSYYPEGIPRVLQEAMAMQKVIITTDTNGCREAVIEGRNGWLVKPQSADDLADKMKRVINMDTVDLLRMGKAGREIAINVFDEKISIGQYMDLVNTSLNNAVTTPIRESKASETKS